MTEVSVLLPARNSERYIGLALKSVLAQDAGDFDVVVVDDGSTDRTLNEIDRVADRRVRVVRGPSCGLGAALAHGLAHISAPFVARMDADDLMLPGRLKLQLEHMRVRQEIGALGGAIRPISATGHRHPRLHTRLPLRADACRMHLAFANPLAHPAVLFRQSAVQDVGGYDEDAVFEDYDLWLRLARRFDVANLPATVLAYRWHGSNTYLLKRGEAVAQLAPTIVGYCRDLLGLSTSEAALRALLDPRGVRGEDGASRRDAREHLLGVLEEAQRRGVGRHDYLALRRRAAVIANQLAFAAGRPRELLERPASLAAVPRLAAVAVARRCMP